MAHSRTPRALAANSVGPVLVASAVSEGAARDRTSDGPARAARTAGRALLHELLRALDADDAITAHCEVCGSDSHGRPVTASGSALLSVAYAPGLVVAAAAPASAGRAIGVDVEADRAPGPMPELAALFAPLDPPDVRAWTRIEAVLKADGRGLRIPPHLVVAHPDEQSRLFPAGHRVAVPGRGSRIEVTDAPAPAGFVVSVAIDPG